MSRQNMSRVTATLDGVFLGVFEELDPGSGTDSQETKYRLGGMGPTISLGGNREVDNIVIRKLFDADMRSRRKWIRGRVGKGVLVVSDQPLNLDGEADGEPDVYTCTLKRFAPPTRAADADDAAQVEMEGTVNGDVG
jgi:hypothetical protein